MARFEDFLGLPSWTRADLDAYMALKHDETDNAEYKAGEWLVDSGGISLVKTRRNDIREYAAGISTAGGGLMFLGVGQKQRPDADVITGVDRRAWGGASPVQVIGNILAAGIHPRMHPPPRIHVVPVPAVGAGLDVIVIDLRRPVHAYYTVLHGGTWVPIRFGDGILRAPPGLVSALAGDRGRVSGIPQLRYITDDEYRDIHPRSLEAIDRAPRGHLRVPFHLENAGLGPLEDVRIVVITSTTRTIQSEVFVEGSSPHGHVTSVIPRPLQGIFEVEAPAVRWAEVAASIPPYDHVDLVIGVEAEGLNIRGQSFGLCVVAKGVEPIIEAYRVYGVAGAELPSRAESLGDGPFDLRRTN